MLKTEIHSLDVFRERSVYARPHHEPQRSAGVSPAHVGKADVSLGLKRSMGRRDTCATLLAILLLTLSFSPTSLWACAACTGRTDSPLAVAMNWGIVTLLGVVLTVLSGVLVFFVHVIRKEETATHDAPPENPPKT
ncbi:MAG: hypothetical protein ABSG80_04010 [Verrucomicrobiota bacterium]